MAPELLQVLKGLALNRQPGWNFPGNFLELSFDEVACDRAHLSLNAGPHCVDADGQVNLAGLAILADIGMAATMRRQVGLGARMATHSMALQFTGARRDGPLEVRAEFDGFVKRASACQGLARASITSGDSLVCTASSTFIMLGERDATAPLPMRRNGSAPPVEPLALEALTEEERIVFARARKAMIARRDGSFIERFWGLEPRRNGNGASCALPNGPHVGNRVGHTQGGITFTLAATTGAAALDDAWRLVGASAWYLSPGTGAVLRARARIVHQGARTAVVRTRVSDAAGRAVLEAVTNHSRLAAN